MCASKRSLWLTVLLVLGGPPIFAGPASAVAPTGEVRILLMVVDGSEPVPRDLRHHENGQVTNVTWSDVSTIHHFAFEGETSHAKLVAQMSYDQTTIAGDTISLAFPYAAYDLTWVEWTGLADAEARNLGFDPADYDRLLYVLPHLPKDAPAVGLANGRRGWCAFLSYIELGCLFHEFGHTIGLLHAGELRPDGSTNGLGDDSDGLMGSGFNAHVNIVNKLLAGWLGGNRLRTFDRTGSDTFTLAPQSGEADTPQAVQIVNNGARPGTGPVDTLVSFRDTGGFDAQLLMSLPDHNGDDVANAVLVHQRIRFFGTDTIYLRALGEGEIYDEHGVSVEVIDLSGDHATVTVSRAPYQPQRPFVSISPPATGSKPGELRYYKISITNVNNPATTTFDAHYEVTLPSFGPDWIVGWTRASAKTAPPGGTAEYEFVIASPRTAVPAEYPFHMTVTDRDGDYHPVSVLASASHDVFPVPEPGFSHPDGLEPDPPGAARPLAAEGAFRQAHAMSDSLVLDERDGDVAILTFHDPDRRNAMSQAMGEAFSAQVAKLAVDDSLRAVVLTGAGRAFSAGGDLGMISSRADEGGESPGSAHRRIRDTMRSFYKLFLSVRDLACPTVAAINGAAVGAGLCVALACDARIVNEKAKLGLNFTRLGLHPGMGATWTLPRLVGPALAAELLYSGRLVTGAEAARIGMANRALPPEDVLPAARALAQEFAGSAPLAVRGVKRALARSADASLEDQLSFEADVQARCFETEDVKEGLAAARERREPAFRGR